jgi:hypothetical protein
MSKLDYYREILRGLEDWDDFLMRESGLPGPRGNLELAQAVAEEGDEVRFRHYLDYTPEAAPTNTPGEFLAFCGVFGLGALLARGRVDLLPELRAFANDPRWRLREAVAMALQRWGDADMDMLLDEISRWVEGTLLEQRAAAAGLCEPRLLDDAQQVERVLAILDRITANLAWAADRRSEAFKALRKGLGYCWSVAVVAHPESGKAYMERWFDSQDRDVRWVMRENLKKKRLARMDAAWDAAWLARFDSGGD